MTNYPNLFADLAAPFELQEVRTRPQGHLNLYYITARTAMNRLDSVLGPENWWDEYEQREHTILCRLTIRLPDGGTVTKADAGASAGMSDSGDDEKSAVSDAFKRACAKFGVGRYLYGDGFAKFQIRHEPAQVQTQQTPIVAETASAEPASISTSVSAVASSSSTPSDSTAAASPNGVAQSPAGRTVKENHKDKGKERIPEREKTPREKPQPADAVAPAPAVATPIPQAEEYAPAPIARDVPRVQPAHPVNGPHGGNSSNNNSSGGNNGGPINLNSGVPRTGKALFGWAKDIDARFDAGIIKYLTSWGKLQEFPVRIVDWDGEQVAQAHTEAARRLQSMLPVGPGANANANSVREPIFTGAGV